MAVLPSVIGVLKFASNCDKGKDVVAFEKAKGTGI
jgi:hypothetical protein